MQKILNKEEVRMVIFLCSYMHNEFRHVAEKEGVADMLGKVAKLHAKMRAYERERLADQGHELAQK